MTSSNEQTAINLGEAKTALDHDASAVDLIGALSAEAAAKASTLQADLDDAQARAGFFAMLAEYVRKEWPVHQCWLMEGKADLLKRMRQDSPDVGQVLEGVYRAAKDRAKRNGALFPSQIEMASKAAGIPLNMDLSRHPVYYFHGRFFKLQVDDTRNRAKLSTTQGDLASIPADAGAVVERLAVEEARVFGQRVTARPFMAKLRKAYLAEAKAMKKAPGDAVPIRRVLRRLQQDDKKFRTDAFLAGLTQLIREDRTAIDGYTMDMQQIKSADEGVLLPGLEDRGLVGYITFKRE